MLALGAAAMGAAHASPVSDAAALIKHKKFAEARALLEPIASAGHPDPEACYYLGVALEEVPEKSGLDSARTWLSMAVRLAPENETFLAEYAGVCLLLADRDSSFTLALEGRNAMTRAIERNPADLEAREGLMTFYAQAPWPLGDADKALVQAAEIARRDPVRGGAAYRKIAGIFRRDGRSEKAESALKAAQNLAPDAPR